MKLKKLLIGSALAAAAVVSVAVGTGKVHAAQIPWTGGNLPSITTPVFNTYTNLPNGIGDESDFVRLRASNGDNKTRQDAQQPATIYTDPLSSTCAVGDKFDVRTYVHNGANDDYNANGAGSAVAKDVTVAMTAPLGKTAKKFVFTSTVSGKSASDPDHVPVSTVRDTGTLNCASNVQLKLVPHTVHVDALHTGWSDGLDSAVNGSMLIGSRVAGSGIQWGCFEDRVIVVYTVEVVPVPVTPLYTCDALTADSLGNRRFRYNLRYTAQNGATLNSIMYDFGDSTSPLSTQNTTVEHTYAKDGQYATTTTLTFMVNGQTKVVVDAKCAVNVTAAVPPTPVVPTVLPNTGPGDVIGLFGATSVAGATAHYAYNKRRGSKRGL